MAAVFLRSALAGVLMIFTNCQHGRGAPPGDPGRPESPNRTTPEIQNLPPAQPARVLTLNDSSQLMRVPRSIRGVLTNSVTGAPIARAAIVLHHGPIGHEIWGKTYTDSLGRYWFFNPPVGLFLLQIQCPPWRFRAGQPMDAPSEYLSPGENKVLNRSSDSRLCNGPTRARPLHGGALESPEARSSNYPSGEAAAVYRAVLDALFPAPWKRGASLVLSQMTSSQWFQSDPGLIFEGLRTREKIDLTTVKNFVEVNQQPVPLRANFGAPYPVYLLTDSNRQYLEEEAAFYEVTFGHSGAYGTRGFLRAFREAYPSARGLVTLSRVGFDPKQTEALVEVAYWDLREEVAGWPVILKKNDGRWAVLPGFVRPPPRRH